MTTRIALLSAQLVSASSYKPSPTKAMAPVTVYFLQASRCIRTVWLLEELGVPYEVEFSDRENMRAPQAFRDASGNPLGKFPTIRDGDVTVWESGAITQYLCEKYDTQHRLIPADPAARAQTLIWVHAAESILMYGVAILYARLNFPAELKTSHPEALEQMEKGMGVNIRNSFDWLENTLAASTSGWLVGDAVTSADIMAEFSAAILLERQIGTKGGHWPKIEAWIKKCEASDAYKRAVQKSGHTLNP